MQMRPTMSTVMVAFLFIVITTITISFCNGNFSMGCIESERQALLKFKQDLEDPANRLASWSVGDSDCCTWSGVVCDNLTGHVYELNLRTPRPLVNLDIANYAEYRAEFDAYESSKLSGKISSSLLEIKYLHSLDLSDNNFEEIQIPRFLGSMQNLRYLNLSFSDFLGMIPHQLGNLSNLQHLSISATYADDLWWLSNLSLLEHLDLSANLDKSSDSLQVISTLPSLTELILSGCELYHFPPLPSTNFSSLFTLRHLDLSWNSFDGSIPDELQNFTSLRHLDLSGNNFSSSLPDWLWRLDRLEELLLTDNSLQGSIRALGNLPSIKTLDLSFNRFEGGIPIAMRRLCNLRSVSMAGAKLNQDISEVLDIFSKCVSNELEYLDLHASQLFGHLTNQLGKFKNLGTLSLAFNSISGPIPSSLGQLSSLQVVYLSHNKLNGTLSEIHFMNLTKLLYFEASENSLLFNVSLEWIPPFKLILLGLSSCCLGPQFPPWLHSQIHLRYLDISHSSIVDTIPESLFKFPFQLVWLNLSHNNFYGRIPNLTKLTQLDILDLNSNNLSGPLPLIHFNLFVIDLSHNALSGSIFHFLCCKMNESKTSLDILNLSENILSGELPDCWMNWQNLEVLKLNNNSFTSKLPNSIGNLSVLRSLHLRKNNLSGTIPVSFKNLTSLETLDLGENEFVGNIPTWIGESFRGLAILNLHSNNFQGHLPIEICHLNSLRILDLAYNNFAGTIPRCINNLSTMSMETYSDIFDMSHRSKSQFVLSYMEDALLVNKGSMVEYNTILQLVRIMDLSKNRFSGEIPTEVTKLKMLQTLNLSQNFFTDRIPVNIGSMRSLESLDLSTNQLFGEIPQSISSLTFLSCLDLSKNNLTGKIPSGTQLQGFDASCFSGNELCGPPLPNNCTVTVSIPAEDNKGGQKDSNEREVDWFYVSMALGFVVGFWIVIGPLLISRRWRYRYYHLLYHLQEKLGSALRK